MIDKDCICFFTLFIKNYYHFNSTFRKSRAKRLASRSEASGFTRVYPLLEKVEQKGLPREARQAVSPEF
jgi:hypothetical protein